MAAFLLTTNPIFRSGEDCRHSKINNAQDISSSTSLDDIVDIEHRPGIDEEIAVMVRDVIARNAVNVDLGLIEEIVAELVSNFARHSRGPLAALMMQFYPRLQTVRLSIGDCGIGIRASLSSNPMYQDLATQPHYVAAVKAFKPGVTSSHEGGMGLGTVTDDLQELNGQLVLVTGDGYVRKSGSARLFKYGEMPFELSGVQIEVEIPTR